MPLFEYECTKCRHRFERIVKFSERDDLGCPECDSLVERLVHAPAIQFKGAGWYVTDYAEKGKQNKKAAKAEADANQPESSTKADSASKSDKAGKTESSSPSKSDENVKATKSA